MDMLGFDKACRGVIDGIFGYSSEPAPEPEFRMPPPAYDHGKATIYTVGGASYGYETGKWERGLKLPSVDPSERPETGLPLAPWDVRGA